MLSMSASLASGVLFLVTSDEADGPAGRSTSANHPGMLSFARGVGWT